MPRQQNQKNVRRQDQQMSALKTQMNGQVVSPSPDPPTVNLAPWNQIVVRSTFTIPATGRYVFDVTSAINALRGQLNACATEVFEFRSLRISAWELSQKSIDLAPLSLIAVNVSGTPANKPLVEMHDTPGENHHAKLGYIWPKSHQDVVFSSDDTASPLFEFYVLGGSEMEFHLQILWRIKRPDVTPMVFLSQNNQGMQSIRI